MTPGEQLAHTGLGGDEVALQKSKGRRREREARQTAAIVVGEQEKLAKKVLAILETLATPETPTETLKSDLWLEVNNPEAAETPLLDAIIGQLKVTRNSLVKTLLGGHLK